MILSPEDEKASQNAFLLARGRFIFTKESMSRKAAMDAGLIQSEVTMGPLISVRHKSLHQLQP
jgi:hypothetical protein